MTPLILDDNDVEATGDIRVKEPAGVPNAGPLVGDHRDAILAAGPAGRPCVARPVGDDARNAILARGPVRRPVRPTA